MKANYLNFGLIVWVFGGIFSTSASAARLKDIASLKGARENQLMGYGIVVGLPGTGDRASDYTENSLGMLVRGLGIDLKTPKLETKNTAAVLVTAILPAFAKIGEHLDISVSSIGSASSLDGGSLMATALKGADGKVYAMAQGRIIMARRAERGGTPTILPMVGAEISGGALLEKEVAFDLKGQREIHYSLAHPDFTTAARIAQKINDELSGKFASATDAGNVDVKLPYDLQGTPVDLIARIESLDVDVDRRAKVVINRRNGTVVLGENVRISPASIAFNNLRIQIRDEGREPQTTLNPDPADAPPPGPVTLNQSKVPRRMQVPVKGASIADIVTSLNEVGAGPEDLVFMVKALKSSGALVAEIELE